MKATGRVVEKVVESLIGEQGMMVADAALKSLKERKITPSPENYAIWLAYHSSVQAALRAELDMMIAAKRVIDDQVCDQLYIKYFEDVAIGSRMMKAGGKIAAEMEDVRKGLLKAGVKTKAYGEQLEIAKRELAKTDSPLITRDLVDSLVGATSEMASQSKNLETKLAESSIEIEALRVQLEQVRIEAATDSLTGLANRKEFDSRLAEMSAASDRGAGPMTVIMADIDFFKRINDTFGHQTGDQVIRFVATVMDRAKPKGGIVARLGGEEFAMIAPMTDRKTAMSIAEKIRQAVEGKRLVRRASNEDLGKITVSLGVSQRRPGEKPTDMVERADAALYASKRNGRNRVSQEELTKAKAA
ncbi:MAG: GGDEF domain-containing protein [Aquidulcibacter sp.]|jgi:diguanylate cyclase|uniref:GGDEF domain-containing protein n=1 Tax=Aquidulcibacter sp. TaxID=2052990 RepID=UPI0022C550C5|nr:GGDEF domain-containing protein [Aquidulcibacter sp.]MCE2891645.1 GGDEF domain-containing protein [Hyphomonadaceae bacterium]MCZ8207412.1 GGDEF domain-containing protein [Aquidulcibacter sp.]